MQLIKVLNISDCLSRKIRWDRIKDNKLFSFNNLQVWISIFFNVTARRCAMKEESFSTTFVLSESFCHSLLSEAFYMFSFYDEPENHHCKRKIFSEVMTSPGYLYWRKNTKKNYESQETYCIYSTLCYDWWIFISSSFLFTAT